MSTPLPVVDFSILNIAVVSKHEASKLRESGAIKPLVGDVMAALTEYGFCYLGMTGFPDEKIETLSDQLRRVFALPDDVKQTYAWKDAAALHGYATRASERSKETHSVERYETFRVCPRLATGPSAFPKEVPEFKPAALDVIRDLHDIALRVLDVIGVGCGLQDSGFFSRCHDIQDSELRPTLYHRYPDDFEPEAGQLRFFEHHDLGTIALICQDSAGGLQVKTRGGVWVDAVPIPGTIILIVGQLLQIWTADKIKAPLHRVVIPGDQAEREKDRISVTHFPVPPDDFVFRCVDGSEKYPPVTLKDFTLKRLTEGTFDEIHAAG